MIKKIITRSDIETEKLASQIGLKLRGGEIFELVGDLGCGKTTFVRGLVKGAGSVDNVSSPTFTISNIYRSGKLTIYHYDFYRLSEPGLVAEELTESLEDKQGVILIEWGQSVQNVLPKNKITITLDRTATNPEERLIKIEFLKEYNYLVEEIT